MRPCVDREEIRARHGARAATLRSFVALLLLGVTSCTAVGGETGRTAHVTASPNRPILYHDVTGKCSALESFAAAVRPDGNRAFELPGVHSMSWAPDGRRFVGIVEREGTRTLMMFHADGTPARSLRELFRGSLHDSPRWAPDGKSFAMMGGLPATLSIVDDGGEIVQTIRMPAELSPDRLSYFTPEKLRWSPDGRHILIVWRTTIVVTVGSGAIETVTAGPALAEWAPSSDAVYYFSPEASRQRRELGQFHIKRLGNNPMRLLDAAAVESIGWSQWRGLRVGRITLSPSASRMAVVGAADKSAHVIRVYDTRLATPLDLARPVAAFRTRDLIVELEWSPDERQLAAMAVIWDPEPTAAILMLDVATGNWTTLARTAIPLIPGCIEILSQANVTWSR